MSICIRVQKVWDWTVALTQDQSDIRPPDTCIAAMTSFMAANPGVPITVVCTGPIIPVPLDPPIVPKPAPLFCPPDELCCLEIGREDVTLSSGIMAQLVAMIASVPLHMVVTGNGTFICEFDTYVKIFEKDVLCAPQGTDVLCRVTLVTCDAVLLAPEQIVVNVAICKEIQVEAEVKLEVLAKFCRPRSPIPLEISQACPPVGQFPEQCPNIFPEVDHAVGPQFLYVANFIDDTVEIYNISNPENPARVGQFNGGNLNDPTGLAITGTTLYVANEGDSTVEIYNISTPTDPVRVGEINMTGDLNAPVGLVITGTTLYVANFGDNRVEIYNISTPADPIRVGEINMALNLDGPVGMAITGTTLYVSNINDNTVEIYDITFPSNPIRVGQFGPDNLNSPVGLAITGTTLYVANANNNTVEIYNISNPTNPLLTGAVNAGNLNTPVGFAITGTTLYVSNALGNNVEIYNISLPNDPIRVGEFNSGNLSNPFGMAIFEVFG